PVAGATPRDPARDTRLCANTTSGEYIVLHHNPEDEVSRIALVRTFGGTTQRPRRYCDRGYPSTGGGGLHGCQESVRPNRLRLQTVLRKPDKPVPLYRLSLRYPSARSLLPVVCQND